MDSFENPFRPGAGTPPPALIGRDELIENYSIALRRTLAGRAHQPHPIRQRIHNMSSATPI